MKKISTVFEIDYENSKIATNVVRPENQWVIDGEGDATVKYDGTAVLIMNQMPFKRYDRKLTKYWKKNFNKIENFTEDMFKIPPQGFVPVKNQKPDLTTGHWPGWVPITSSPEDKYHNEGIENYINKYNKIPDGTFELIGPKVQGNPYELQEHILVKHGSLIVFPERSYEGIKKWLEDNFVEGLVFHGNNKKMAKIRRKDFGLSWN